MVGELPVVVGVGLIFLSDDGRERAPCVTPFCSGPRQALLAGSTVPQRLTEWHRADPKLSGDGLRCEAHSGRQAASQDCPSDPQRSDPEGLAARLGTGSLTPSWRRE